MQFVEITKKLKVLQYFAMENTNTIFGETVDIESAICSSCQRSNKMYNSTLSWPRIVSKNSHLNLKFSENNFIST